MSCCWMIDSVLLNDDIWRTVSVSNRRIVSRCRSIVYRFSKIMFQNNVAKI
jgi:hypothetical protein